MSSEERAWLQEHPVLRVGAETDWPPFDFVAAGRAKGLSNDYVRLLAEKVGWQVEFIHGPPFSALLDMSRRRDVDLLPALWRSSERENFVAFSFPYYETRHVIFFNQDIPKVTHIDDLKGLRLIGVESYQSTERLKDVFGAEQVQEVASPLDALIAINSGEADVFAGTLAIGSHYIHEHGLNRIRVSTDLQGSIFTSNEALHMGMRNDWPIGVKLLKRAQLAVSPSEMAALRHRWVVVPGSSLTWQSVASWVLGAVAVIAGVLWLVIAWNRRLARDLRQRQAAEQAIAKNRAHLIAVIEATDDGIWSLDRDYVLTLSNPAFHAALRVAYGVEVNVGESLLQVLPASLATDWRQRYDRVLAGERFSFVNHIAASDGESKTGSRDVEYRLSPIKVDGEVVGVSCTMHDVSVQKRLERNLRRAKDDAEHASEVKGMFLANMSHEIRTPMNGIIGLADLLRSQDLPVTAKAYVQELSDCAETLLGLIDDVLNFSKIEAGKIEIERIDFEIRDLIDQILVVARRASRNEGVVIDATVSEDVSRYVHGDENRLRQCLLNLMSNAVKFTARGEVSLNVSTPVQDMVTFTVRDTGVGIPEERLGAIFDVFTQADASTTRQFGGSGLGLAITNRLVQLMGGDVAVTSSLGQGSEFVITLPLKASEASAVRILSERLPIDIQWHGKEVLLVEDNEVNVLVMERLLSSFGFTVSVAHNGMEAIDSLRDNCPDLVFMDCHMPVMDGLAATRRLRQLDGPTSSVPVIALTADVMDGSAQACRDAGMDDYLSKPVKRDILRAVLERHLAVSGN